jgi:hypothetical protein
MSVTAHAHGPHARPSKTRLKQDSHELQSLGEALVEQRLGNLQAVQAILRQLDQRFAQTLQFVRVLLQTRLARPRVRAMRVGKFLGVDGVHSRHSGRPVGGKKSFNRGWV